MAHIPYTDSTSSEGADVNIDILMEIAKDCLVDKINPRDIVTRGPSFLEPGEDSAIVNCNPSEGTRTLFCLAKQRRRNQELVQLLEPDYPTIFGRLLSEDILALCKKSSMPANEMDEESDWRLLHLLRGNIYSKVEPRDILQHLECRSFVSRLEGERIRGMSDRFDACLELVTVLARKRSKGSYSCLLKALCDCSMREAAEEIDPDCSKKIAMMSQEAGGGLNNLSREHTPDAPSNDLKVVDNLAVETSAPEITCDPEQSAQLSSPDETGLKAIAGSASAAAAAAAAVSPTVHGAAAATAESAAGIQGTGAGAGSGSEQQQLRLRPYQEEVAEPALKGLNCIICMPTNSGKTIVAAHVIEKHLQSTSSAKVVFIAPRVALVNQQYDLFKRYLGHRHKIHCITGDSEDVFRLRQVVDENDVLVLTPQILVNALAGIYSGTDNSRSARIDSLSAFTLLVLDECHHCIKASPYNELMFNYLSDKLKGHGHLPQVIGLTATLGVGDANSDDAAVEHILKVCANLACDEPPKQVSREIESLRVHVSVPLKERHTARDRPRNEFSSIILKAMSHLEDLLVYSLDGTPLAQSISSERPPDRLVQAYQQWVIKNSRAAKETLGGYPQQLQLANVCLTHLLAYWEALDIWQCARHKDAFKHLKDCIQYTDTDVAKDAETLLKETKQQLEPLLNVKDDNPRLEELALLLRSKFMSTGGGGSSRGLIFVQTRELTAAVCEWIEELDGGAFKHVRPLPFTGVHASADKGGLTSNKQEDVLKAFRAGETSLLVCTSVAEEGLDIPECNFSIRYLKTVNEISAVQARGRVRRDQGIAHTISARDREKKEELNVQREAMMQLAMEYISAMAKADFRGQVAEHQRQAVRAKEQARLAAACQPPKTAESFTLRCGRCNTFVVAESGLRVFKGAHHIVADPRFEERVNVLAHLKPSSIGLGMVKDRKIGCKNCRLEWGIGMIMSGCSFFVIKVDPFAVESQNNGRGSYKKWKDFPYHLDPIEDADLIELGRQKIVNSELPRSA